MDDKLVQYKFRQWHFWWLVVFSFLLIIIFVYYLPTRFLQQAIQEEVGHGEGSMMMDEDIKDERMQEHMKNGMTEEEMMEHMMSAPAEGGSVGGEGVENGDMMAKDHGSATYYEEDEGLVVNLNVSPVPFKIDVPLKLDFFVNQKPGDMPVLANQLEVEHEKLMHVIGVRSDMNEFFHIHPEFLADNPSVFSIDHIFKKPGLYKIWSEIKKDGIDYFFGHPEVNVNGLGLREEKKISFSRNVVVSQYQISLEVSDSVVGGKEVELSFDIHSLTGTEIEVEQYLGADMHLSIIRDDWSNLIHTHPNGKSSGEHSRLRAPQNVALAHGGTEDEPAAADKHQTSSRGDEAIIFHVTFPEAGLYKTFAQFRPKGIGLPTDEALLAEFWIQVEEKASLPVSQWWGLLVVSVALIAGLSWWVNRYLKVKPEDVSFVRERSER